MRSNEVREGIQRFLFNKRVNGDLPVDIQRRAVSKSSADWIPGQILLNDFVVDRVLGEGGMGKVYLVKSQTTNMRFAVKRAKGLKEDDRRNFLAELQTWIDLPEHPNLVPCRFFRSVGNEVLIFAEYVEGGSLKEWIASRTLYAGGAYKALERLLDTAIQFAWSLHCVHELGLVHQDVKPANVMMGYDAQVAVQGFRVRTTDFGLARAWATGGDRPVAELGRSILVSSGGYTPAYCSPEQAAGLKLDQRTDVWSWGISVLEMFQSEVVWQSGRVAAMALEAYLKKWDKKCGIPAMPMEVADLLKGCFREDPAQRWQNLEVVVQNLKNIYQAAIGTEYSCVLCKIEHRGTPQAGVGERRDRAAVSWTDPRAWLERALCAEGRDPAEAAGIIEKHANSRRGQLTADIAVYDEARCIYERLIKCGQKDLDLALASLCVNAAFVHSTVDDFSGALTLYDRAIEIHERHVNVEGQRELADSLASAYMNKAVALMDLGNISAAVGLFDRAIVIWERLVNVEGRCELADNLAKIYIGKANALTNLGNITAAVGLFDQAIEIYERLVNVEGRSELVDDLATAYMNKAIAFSDLGDSQSAVVLYDQAIEIYERLVNVEGRSELANILATAYMNKAIAFSDLGDSQSAVVLYDRAIEIRVRLVKIEGRRELADDLAKLYMNKAIALRDMGDMLVAVDLYDQAIVIWERLVNVEGRRELTGDLAMAYINKAIAHRNLGDSRSAMVLCDMAIEIYERLVNVEGRSELVDRLAMVYMSKANALSNLGDSQSAVVLYDQAIEIHERLVNVEGRSELVDDLAKIYMSKANALMNLGDISAAVVFYDRAIEIRERLVKIEDRQELAGDLAWVKAYHGRALVVLGDTERGKREIREAMVVLRAEVKRTDRADLKMVLDWAVKQVGE